LSEFARRFANGKRKSFDGQEQSSIGWAPLSRSPASLRGKMGKAAMLRTHVVRRCSNRRRDDLNRPRRPLQNFGEHVLKRSQMTPTKHANRVNSLERERPRFKPSRRLVTGFADSILISLRHAFDRSHARTCEGVSILWNQEEWGRVFAGEIARFGSLAVRCDISVKET